MIPSEFYTLRLRVAQAFNPDTGYFNHVYPYTYSNFIDGMAWVGLLCGACYRVGDITLAGIAEEYLSILLKVGKDARNYAPIRVNNKWIKSNNTPYWYIKKPQSFAGPAALRFAINSGAQLISPFKIEAKAKMYTKLGSVYGMISKRYNFFNLRQHLNSIWLAYLITGDKVPNGLLWSTFENPFFSYIAGIRCNVPFPLDARWTSAHTEISSNMVKLKDAKPSAWLFRRDPYKIYVRDGDVQALQSRVYTPLAELVSGYLQSTLNDN